MLLITGAALLGIGLLLAALFAGHPGPLGLDTRVLDQLIGTRSDALTPAVKAISYLFSPVGTIVAAVVVTVALAWSDRSLRRPVQILIATGTAAAVAAVLKVIVARPRPPEYLQIGAPEATLSFPSGHVTGTAALVTSLLVVLLAGRPARWAAPAVLAGAGVIALVAWTRLYLGMHWFTDTLGGALVGTGTVLLVVPILASLGELPGRSRQVNPLHR